MKRIIAVALIVPVLVYTVMQWGSSPAKHDITIAHELEALKQGDMKKLIFHNTPRAVPETPFQLPDGAGEKSLNAYKGKYVLVNFWATWCAPCRKEMPMLSSLQSQFGGARFEVVTIATGRNTPAGISRFFEQSGIDNLPRYQDPKQSLAAEMGVLGLPVTVILDPQGYEIARLQGDADWASDSAKEILNKLITE